MNILIKPGTIVYYRGATGKLLAATVASNRYGTLTLLRNGQYITRNYR